MKNVLQIVLVNIGLFSILIIVAELVFGNWFSAPALWNLGIYRDVQWSYGMEDSYRRTTPVIHTRDYYGFRGTYDSIGSVNVLAIGGSTTEESGVSDHETWSEVFERCMKKHDVLVEIANAGISGQSTVGHIANFDIWLNKIDGLAPKYILAYFGVNEQQLDGRADTHDALQNVGARSWWKNFRINIKMNSAIFILYRTIKGNLIAFATGIHPLKMKVYSPSTPAALRTTQEKIDDELRGPDAPRFSINSDQYLEWYQLAQRRFAKPLDRFEGRLEQLRKKIIAFGAKPIFVTQRAGNYRLRKGILNGNIGAPKNDEPTYFWITLLSERTMSYCKKNRMTCVDLGSHIRFDDGDFYDPLHTTPTGSEKIGRHICDNLTQHLEFDIR